MDGNQFVYVIHCNEIMTKILNFGDKYMQYFIKDGNVFWKNDIQS